MEFAVCSQKEEEGCFVSGPPIPLDGCSWIQWAIDYKQWKRRDAIRVSWTKFASSFCLSLLNKSILNHDLQLVSNKNWDLSGKGITKGKKRPLTPYWQGKLCSNLATTDWHVGFSCRVWKIWFFVGKNEWKRKLRNRFFGLNDSSKNNYIDIDIFSNYVNLIINVGS